MGTSPCVQFTELLGWGLLNTLHNWIHGAGLYPSVKNGKRVLFKTISYKSNSTSTAKCDGKCSGKWYHNKRSCTLTETPKGAICNVSVNYWKSEHGG